MSKKYPLDEIYELYDRAFPVSLRCDWDNDGLMLGMTEPEKAVGRVLFTLDVTSASARYAIENGCDLIVSHHPLIFRPLKSVSDPKLLGLLEASVAVMSFHTRLDAADGGVNDTLARLLGLENVSHCCGEGIIRHGFLPSVESFGGFCARITAALGCPYLSCVQTREDVRHVAVCGGDGKDFYREAVDCGCDTYVTGNLSYNMMADASDGRINVIEAGHFFTENPVCRTLEAMLKSAFPEIETMFFGSDPVDVKFPPERSKS